MGTTALKDGLILANRYQIARQVGQGGMATVYVARDLKLDRDVAVKVLRPELGAVLGTERFLAEVRITARLEHAHILTVIDSGEVDGLLYYVMPFVRGESLRSLMDRERQLSIDTVLRVTTQIASALDYAHRHGIVHRDIKPENILFLEGEAMLTDFGIALAVEHSGVGRLTETGLSLGTPHYMSPEQATADRSIDARSDQYSLACVSYEMLVGEPPITGRTPQALIARLMTEMPTPIRAVRPTVELGMEQAIRRALAKVPADRFDSAGAFASALAATTPATVTATSGVAAAQHSGTVGSTGAKAVAGRRWLTAAVGLAAVAAGAFVATRLPKSNSATATLRDREQLTFTGNTYGPTMSADGKQLAYLAAVCDGSVCDQAVDIVDVGNTSVRRLLRHVTDVYDITWSPDRRYLILGATIDGRSGSHLVSALDGTTAYVASGYASFYAGGDSLLSVDDGPVDSSFTVRVAGINGTVVDSVRVRGNGGGVGALIAVPGSTRFVALLRRKSRALWQLMERDGAVRDSVPNDCLCGGAASRDALWMVRAGNGAGEAVVRVAIDATSGRLNSKQDTIHQGTFTNMSVTADGHRMAIDEGGYKYSVSATALEDVVAGSSAALTPLVEASASIQPTLSPDGGRLLLRRTIADASGVRQARYSVRMVATPEELPLRTSARALQWIDSVTLIGRTSADSLSSFEQIDARTGNVSALRDVPSRVSLPVVRVKEGWAWVETQPTRIIVRRNGQDQTIAAPAGIGATRFLVASPSGEQLLLVGKTKGGHLLVVARVDAPAASSWGEVTGYLHSATLTGDGQVAIVRQNEPGPLELLRWSTPGEAQRKEFISRATSGLMTISQDLRRVAFPSREYRGDAWIYQVVK